MRAQTCTTPHGPVQCRWYRYGKGTVRCRGPGMQPALASMSAVEYASRQARGAQSCSRASRGAHVRRRARSAARVGSRTRGYGWRGPRQVQTVVPCAEFTSRSLWRSADGQTKVAFREASRPSRLARRFDSATTAVADKHRTGGRINTCRASASGNTRASQCNDEQDGGIVRDELVRVALPCAGALLLCNLYRVFLPIALMRMAPTFGWNAAAQGSLMSAFLLGYACTQVVGGRLADAVGGRNVLGAGMIFCVLTTAATPWLLDFAGRVGGGGRLSLAVFLATRLAVGLGEGVSMPSMQNLVARNVARERRASVLGVVMAGFHGGNMVGLMMSPAIMLHPAYGSWQALFVVYSLLALPLVVAWWRLVPSLEGSLLVDGDRAAPFGGDAVRSTRSNDTDVRGEGSMRSNRNRVSGPIPLREMLASPSVWAVIIGTVVNHWGYFIYLTWLPAFLNLKVGFDIRASSIFAVLPWLAMAVGGQYAGRAADGLAAAGVPLVRVRKAFQAVSFAGPAAALGLVMYMQSSFGNACPAALYVGAFVAALGSQSLGQAGFFTNPQDIAPRRAGSIVGVSNTAGSLAGLVGTGLAGWILEATGGSWSAVFALTIGLYVAGTVAYSTLATADNIFDADDAEGADELLGERGTRVSRTHTIDVSAA